MTSLFSNLGSLLHSTLIRSSRRGQGDSNLDNDIGSVLPLCFPSQTEIGPQIPASPSWTSVKALSLHKFQGRCIDIRERCTTSADRYESQQFRWQCHPQFQERVANMGPSFMRSEANNWTIMGVDMQQHRERATAGRFLR